MDAEGHVWYHLSQGAVSINNFTGVTSSLEQQKKILIQCDFDGTATKEDISFMLLDAFAKGDWRAINRQYTDGKISVGQFNEMAFGLVETGKKVMLDYIKNKAKLRPGFKDFVKLCEKKGIRLVIVSNGLDFYIRNILESNGLKGLEYHAAESKFYATGLRVRYLGPGGDVVDSGFKEKYVEHYQKEGYQVIYIGNGTSDLSPARNCYKIFATESLLKNCKRNNIRCIPFASFIEINSVIKSW